MKKQIKKTFLMAFVVLSFAGCSKKAKFNELYDKTEVESAAGYVAGGYNAAPKMMKRSAVKETAEFAYDDAVEFEEAMVEKPVSSETEIENYERKLIKTGDVSLQVPDLSEGEASIEKWASEINGYISYSSCSEYSSYFTVKVPCEKFDSAMDTVGTFGQIKNRSISTQDVSEQYYDLQGRLQTKKILQKNLQKYLEQASNLTDILKIERELNNVTSEVESMEGQLRRLSGQIEYSTININLFLPEGMHNPVIQKPTFSDKMTYFFSQVKNFFGGLIKILLYVIVCGIPCTFILFFLFWLLFGKVGLIKRLIKKLK